MMGGGGVSPSRTPPLPLPEYYRQLALSSVRKSGSVEANHSHSSFLLLCRSPPGGAGAAGEEPADGEPHRAQDWPGRRRL